MGRKEIIINQDPKFADSIDSSCRSCRGGAGNEKQLKNLEDRRLDHPNEEKAIDRVQARCENCNESGKEGLLSSQYSCAWRVGIQKEK